MRGDKSHILVVDDDNDIRTLVEMTLTDHGFAVLTATHGEEALALLDDPNHVAVCLLDLRMPHMDGQTFLAHFRKRPPEKQTAQVVVFTAAADAAKIAQDLGVRRHLAKPMRLAQLLRVVAEALENGLRAPGP